MRIRSVAFIPARSLSKRVANKNIKRLSGHPLMAYSISAAIESGIFDAVICATDSQEYANIATYYGAEVPFLRPVSISTDNSPDIEWLRFMLSRLKNDGRVFDVFSILRPTSPFRTVETIRRAWTTFSEDPTVDSLRAISQCKEHPGKMWVMQGRRMLPVMPYTIDSTPWHSSQYASLPPVYVQNASLEIAWSRVALEGNSIAGEAVAPLLSVGLEGFDINHPDDWVVAEHYIANSTAILPSISRPPFRNI